MMWANAVRTWRPRKQMALVVSLALAVAAPACGSSDDGSGSHPAETGPATAIETAVAGNSPQDSGRLALPDGEPRLLDVRPPCLGLGTDGCRVRDVSGYRLFSTAGPSGGAASGRAGAPTVEEVLEDGLKLAEVSPTHMAFRGTPTADSVRCDWRGVARTPQQRGQAIRFWLDLAEAEALPSTAFLDILFRVTLDTLDPEFRATAKSNFLAIARGGLTTEYLFLTCYAEYTVHEYVLGAGPPKLLVAYNDRGETHSYELCRREHENGSFGAEALPGEAQFQARMDQLVWEAEEDLSAIIAGHESVVFVAPLGAHNAIAVEAWLAVDQWDLQTDDDDTVHAVRYGTSTKQRRTRAPP